MKCHKILTVCLTLPPSHCIHILLTFFLPQERGYLCVYYCTGNGKMLFFLWVQFMIHCIHYFNRFSGLLQFPGKTRQRSLKRLLILLCHKYPRVRQWFLSLITLFSKTSKQSCKESSNLESGLQSTRLAGGSVINGIIIVSDGSETMTSLQSSRCLHFSQVNVFT